MKLINFSEILNLALPIGILLVALYSCQENPAELNGSSIDTASNLAVEQIERSGNRVKVMAEPDAQQTASSPTNF